MLLLSPLCSSNEPIITTRTSPNKMRNKSHHSKRTHTETSPSHYLLPHMEGCDGCADIWSSDTQGYPPTTTRHSTHSSPCRMITPPFNFPQGQLSLLVDSLYKLTELSTQDLRSDLPALCSTVQPRYRNIWNSPRGSEGE